MKKSNLRVVKKSISLSHVVALWSNELAEKKGFGANFSAYIADLIRKDKEKEDDHLNVLTNKTTNVSSLKKSAAEAAIVEAVHEAVREKLHSVRLK